MFNVINQHPNFINALKIEEGSSMFDFIDSLIDGSYNYIIGYEEAEKAGLPTDINSNWMVSIFKRSSTYILVVARPIHELYTQVYKCVKRQAVWRSWVLEDGGGGGA